MEIIAEDMQMEVLSRLPVKSLVSFSSVCKFWHKLITKDPHFCKLHHSRRNKKEASIIMAEYGMGRTAKIYSGFPRVSEFKSPVQRSHEIIGSCNGVICLKHCVKDDSLFLWNPATRQHCLLSTPSSIFNEYTHFGFGFHQDTNAYKVLKINYYPQKQPSVWIYTLGSQGTTWRALGELAHSIYVARKGEKINVLVNGCLHWIQRASEILSFDFGDELFRVIPKPKYDGEAYSTHIGELGGFLCFYRSTIDNEIDIWMMKDYGVAESWTKVAELKWTSNYYIPRPVGLRMGGEVIVCSKGATLWGFKLEGELIGRIDSLRDGYWQACSYIESLVSPRDIAGIGETPRKQRRKRV